MDTLPYSSLTEAQRERAAYLFADETIGTHPAAYLYEVTGGEITGRYRIAGNDGTVRKGGRRPQPGSHVTVMEEAQVTRDALANARDHWYLYLDTLARRIVIHCKSFAENEIQIEGEF